MPVAVSIPPPATFNPETMKKIKRIWNKIYTCWHVMRCHSMVVVTRRGDEVATLSAAGCTDPVWEVAFEQSAMRFAAQAMDDQAERAVAKLKKETGLA